MDARSTGETLGSDPASVLMERNGITRVTTCQYWVDGYRYANLGDALAQAERGARAVAGARPDP